MKSELTNVDYLKMFIGLVLLLVRQLCITWSTWRNRYFTDCLYREISFIHSSIQICNSAFNDKNSHAYGKIGKANEHYNLIRPVGKPHFLNREKKL